MKKQLFVFFAFLMCSQAFSIPAKQLKKSFMQPDGTSLIISLCGDEYLHYYVTDDNIPLYKEDNGSYCYMVINNNQIMSSRVIAHNPDERDYNEIQFVENLSSDIYEKITERWKKKVDETFSVAKARTRLGSSERDSFYGTKKGIVILVNFSDKTMSKHNTQKQFDRQFNEIGYSDNHHIGSVHDYFFDQSYGKFDLTFDVVGPVTVSNELAYYGSNKGSNDGNDRHPGEMVAEACKLIEGDVDFSDYDWDGDGEVNQIFIVYAGYGESNGADSNTIWPHKSSLSACSTMGDGKGAIILDGVKIDTYACTCELAGASGSTMNGIGTACHEFSHCLGLPDFYDVGYGGGSGMSYWDIMSSGGHSGPNNNGEVPCGYTAYEKWFAGWLEYVELDEAIRINGMPSIGDEPVAYAIYNNNNRNEYFLLENRQNRGWYSYVQTSNKCHGLLITHVDYDKNAWARNIVNTSSKHQRMSIIPADNSFGKLVTYTNSQKAYIVTNQELEGDLFPGKCNIAELTNTSHTNTGGKLYNRNIDGTYFMNKPIENISEGNGLISFDIMGGVFIPYPQVKDPSNITDNGFTANWDPVDIADSYTIELTEFGAQGNPQDNILIKEDMNNFVNDDGMGDGYKDLSSVLDQYMNHQGWSGLKVFTSQYGAKIGSSSVNGNLTSPPLRIENGSVTVSFVAKSYNNENTSIELILHSKDNDIVALKEVPISHEETDYVVSLTDFDKNIYQIEITSMSRFYIRDIAIYDGYYSYENLMSNYTLDSTTLRPINKYVVSDIPTIWYRFDNLDGCYYGYRVMAHSNGSKSVWSEYAKLKLKDGTYIYDVINDENEFSDVYGIGGIKIDGIYSKGIYIIRKGNTTKKVLR